MSTMKIDGFDHEEWAQDCHAAALHLVQSGKLGECRVARGSCPGVAGQHSWVVMGTDCYAPRALVVDPTLWSYDKSVIGIWTGTANTRPHRPHGSGSIWQWGRPGNYGGDVITLPEERLTDAARAFLNLLGPLDRKGWAELAHAPVGGWPSGEIFAAMWLHPKLGALIPIDVVGMATDLNPSGLYLASAEVTA